MFVYSQLADQYGADVASEVLARTKHLLPAGHSGLGLGLTPRGGSVNSSAMASQANLESVPVCFFFFQNQTLCYCGRSFRFLCGVFKKMMSYDPSSPATPSHPQAMTTSHVYGHAANTGLHAGLHRTIVHPASSDDRL